MNALSHCHAAGPLPRLSLAREPETAWEAHAFSELVPPDTLPEARARRDGLGLLLRREREAAADFLLALADFDRRRAWERLGHASLFAFLTRELGLSAGAAQLRLSAARLLPRHPAVEAALRSGRLCISAVGQLARVLTAENEAAVLPRFLGLSAREAAEVAAELVPRVDPPRRDLVTPLPPPRPAAAAAGLQLEASPPALPLASPVDRTERLSTPPPGPAPLHTCEVLAPARVPERLPSVEPLTAERRRLHVTVSRAFLDKVARARDGLSHALPGATTEQVLEAALDLLLEQQDRRKALVRRPRTAASGGAAGASAPAPASKPLPVPTRPSPPTQPHAPRRPHIPAAVEREVRLRDGDRCQYPLDTGGTCGATRQVQLDHIVPVALGGETTPANLRCLCSTHNRRAGVLALGPAILAATSRRP